ncbi:hypothetical protein SteCoe_19270 [Stentor coeruleus]|uniref:Uncharacterized protein n=1 Tax=Stentor coeruleus TaxID=5963 RepID=A0A1R2BUY1_9CILI|nr:hypothetical protein SteCoe_19270 [Stentor coeruleus]
MSISLSQHNAKVSTSDYFPDAKDYKISIKHVLNFMPICEQKQNFKYNKIYSVKKYKKKSISIKPALILKSPSPIDRTKLESIIRGKKHLSLLYKNNKSYVKLSHERNISDIGKLNSIYNSPLPNIIYRSYSRKRSLRPSARSSIDTHDLSKSPVFMNDM